MFPGRFRLSCAHGCCFLCVLLVVLCCSRSTGYRPWVCCSPEGLVCCNRNVIYHHHPPSFLSHALLCRSLSASALCRSSDILNFVVVMVILYSMICRSKSLHFEGNARGRLHTKSKSLMWKRIWAYQGIYQLHFHLRPINFNQFSKHVSSEISPGPWSDMRPHET